MERNRSIFVFGLGYSSQAFLTRFGGDFSAVSGTVRTPGKAAQLAARGWAVLPFDARQADKAVADAVRAASVLLVSVPPEAPGDPVLAAYADAVAAAGALERIVYLSTVGVYGDHGGAWIDEAAPLHPTSLRNGWRVGVEREWIAVGEAIGVPVDILRLSGIYGPGRNALVKLRQGTAQRVVKAGQIFNRIHVDDIAGCIAALVRAGGPGGVWNVTDDEPAPPQDVIAYAAGLLGVPVPPDIPFESAEMTPMARSFWGENKRVSNRRIRETLGLDLLYPTYREGIAALAAAGEGR